MLENWSTAFIRIDPSLHDSTTPSFRVFIRSLDARARTFGTIVWYVLVVFALELADLRTILLICFARFRPMPRIGQAYCTVVEILKSNLQIPLLRFRHARTAREREETAKLHTDLRSSILRVGYSRLRRKRSPTIVYSPLFVLLISESKLAGSSQAVMNRPWFH